MNVMQILHVIRCYIAVAGLGVGAAMFWAFLIGMWGGQAVGLSEDHSFSYVFLPLTGILSVIFWRVMPGLLGYDKSDFTFR